MGGNRRIPGCSRKVFTVLVGNVTAVTVFVAFREAEVNYVNFVTVRIICTDQEVVRFDISMNDPILMNRLDKSYKLNGDLSDSL